MELPNRRGHKSFGRGRGRGRGSNFLYKENEEKKEPHQENNRYVSSHKANTPRPNPQPKKEWQGFHHEGAMRVWIENLYENSVKFQTSLATCALHYGDVPWQEIFSGGADKKITDYRSLKKVCDFLTNPKLTQTPQIDKPQKLFKMLSESIFLTRIVPTFLQSYFLVNPSGLQEVVESVIGLIKQLMRVLPEDATFISIVFLEPFIADCTDLQSNWNDLVQLKAKCEKELKSKIVKIDPQIALVNETIDYQSIPILPTPDELSGKTRAHLRKNRIDKPYEENELTLYLDTHYRLLREEYVGGLREGIKACRDQEGTDQVYVYHDVHYDTSWFSGQGLRAPIFLKFKSEKKALDWDHSKRFLPGSLLCLFPQLQQGFDLNNPIFAVCADDSRDNAPFGLVSVEFLNGDLGKFSQKTRYFMVESTCFFGGIQPVLQSLQAFDEKNPPSLYQLLLSGSSGTIPAYLKDAPLDISCLYKKPMPKSLDFVLGEPFPGETEGEARDLMIPDLYQLKAIRHMLTHQLGIVQGPPGTGKTFIGVLVARILTAFLEEQRKGPILVICYTNHALDQFLEDMLPYVPNLIRVGSRSKSQNEVLQSRNLRQLSGKLRGLKFLYEDLVTCVSEIQTMKGIMASVKSHSISEHLLPPSWLKQLRSKYAEMGQKISKGVNFQMFLISWMNGFDGEYFKKEQKIVYKNFYAQADSQSFEDPPEPILETFPVLTDEQVQQEMKGFAVSNKKPTKKTKKFAEFDQDDDIAIELEDRADLEDEDEDIPLGRRFKSPEINPKKLEELAKSVVGNVTNVFSIPVASRVKAVQKIHEWFSAQNFETTLWEKYETYSQFKQLLADQRTEQDLEILRGCPLIGMTSTVAARMRSLLSNLGAPVLMMEEAGELLEAQTISCCFPGLQHLILIGDHQQLRPKVNNFQLEQKFNFNISLLERLALNKTEMVSLRVQLRMQPEISAIVKKFYEVPIEDHERVLHKNKVKGVKHNVFWLTHGEPETSGEGKAKSNTYEAQMTTKIARYLVLQGYSASQITILTPYLGQRREIAALAAKDPVLTVSSPENRMRIVTVDEYQGDENDIVIISTVRSNSSQKIGFLKECNRLIVAVSRAREGMFIVGNSELLGQNPDWKTVISAFEEKDCLGNSLPLACQQHPKTETLAAVPADFGKVVDGGCSRKCEERLPCGHFCRHFCHNFPHESIRCGEDCTKTRECGHKCEKKCYENCDPCPVPLEVTLACGHSLAMKCGSALPACKFPCPRTHPCGHECRLSCGKPCGLCPEKLERTFPCNHTVKYQCGTALPKYCESRCEEILSCKHRCASDCFSGMEHKHSCEAKCGAELFCGHSCKGKCGHEFHYESVCQEKCDNRCSHSKCSMACGSSCIPCQEPCQWDCPHHKCSKRCHQLCDRPPCNQRCRKLCKDCKKQCFGVCGEKCPPCVHCNKEFYSDWEDIFTYETVEDLKNEGKKLFQLEDCLHVFLVDSLDFWMKKDDITNADGHQAIQYKVCPLCKVVIRAANRYGNVVKQRLELIELAKAKVKKQRLALRAAKIKYTQEVVAAMQKELGASSKGHWYFCPNKHPYVIGECGGAMQVSKCPDCGVEVGGSHHKLLDSNSKAEAKDIVIQI